MKMSWQPGRVVNDNVEIVGGVDNASDAAKDENEQAAEEVGEEPAILVEVRELAPPAEASAATIQARAVFHRGRHGERGRETRHREEHRVKGVDELPGAADARLGERTVNADGGGG